MDKDGKLTEKDKEKIVAWLNEKWPAERQQCPICGDTSWLIVDHLVMPVTLGPGNSVQFGGVGYPQVMLVSLKCAYTRLLNASVMGFRPEEPKEQPSTEPQETQKPNVGGA